MSEVPLYRLCRWQVLPTNQRTPFDRVRIAYTCFWGYNPMQDDRSVFTQSRPLYRGYEPLVAVTTASRRQAVTTNQRILFNLASFGLHTGVPRS